jgi:hypothetical protein
MQKRSLSRMETRQLTVESKHRKDADAGFLASLKDFDTSDGGKVNPNVVLENPCLSLYCLDDVDKQAIFVELPPEVDLTKAPFVWQAQYDRASRLIAVPYETFTHLANTLPEVTQPIFVYSTGRSGSTLISHVFNESKVVASLSEPDAASQFVRLRMGGNYQEAELCHLAQSTLRFLFKSYHTPEIQAHALKFRSEALRVMDFYQAAFPQGKNLFLYRDAMGFAASVYRIFKSVGVPEYSSVNDWLSRNETNFQWDFSHLRAYLDDGCEQISSLEDLTVWWIAHMEFYLAQVERGVPVLAVRYADLIQNQADVLKAVFAYCDLPLGVVQQGLKAFDRDAQAGTILARENPKEGNKLKLTEEEIESITAVLQRHPVLKTADFTVPETLQV